MTDINNDELLRLDQVLRALKISKSSFYSGIRVGRFPKAVSLGPRARRRRGKDIRMIVELGVTK